MFIIPIDGRQVPDPERGGCLSPEGREVEATQYWLRRLQDGDVQRVIPQPKKKGG